MAAAIHPVTMPKWGIEMTEGTLNQWSVAEGARVNKGDPLLEVETDKIVNTVESPASSCLRRIVAAVGETMPVGTLIGVLADEAVSESEINTFIANFKGASVSFEPDEAKARSIPQPGTSIATGPPTAPGPAEDVRVSPIARRLAQSLGIDIAKVSGTGRNGRVSKEDVERYAAQLALQQPSRPPAQPAGETASNSPSTVRMSATRATIAKRLLDSKLTIPHYRLSMDVQIGRLRARRAELAEVAGEKITLNDLLVKAAATALVRHPSINAQFDGEEIRQYPHADIAIAVATETGLLTPIVRSADLKSIAQISRVAAGLVERAKAGTLTREDIVGGTFTLSNLGMFGVDRFDAIINPPQVAILAVGAATERVVARDGTPVTAWMMTLTLSADHRVVDGARGAAFLASLRDLLQSPEEL